MWAWVNGQWAEVYTEDQSVSSVRSYYTVDSRISRDQIVLATSEMYMEKPNWVPSPKTGTKIEVVIHRTFQSESSCTRTTVNPETVWYDIDDFLRLKVVAATVTAVNGFQGATHKCGYCEQYSAINPDPKAQCRGCKRISWTPWNGDAEAPKLGKIDGPS